MLCAAYQQHLTYMQDPDSIGQVIPPGTSGSPNSSED